MGLFDEVKDLFVAVPDDKKGQILYKWPDINLRKFSTAIVNADEQALFVNQGQVIGVMPPGRHKIDADELPFLGLVIDWASNGNVLPSSTSSRRASSATSSVAASTTSRILRRG